MQHTILEQQMSIMGDLVLDIKYRLEQGMSFYEIARQLDVPVNFVVEAADVIERDDDQDCIPFATINS